jgi:hypothetical protein
MLNRRFFTPLEFAYVKDHENQQFIVFEKVKNALFFRTKIYYFHIVSLSQPFGNPMDSA